MSQMLAETYDELEDLEIDVENIVTEDETPVDNLFSEKQQRLLTESLYTSWPGPEDEAGHLRPFLVSANVGIFPSLHRPPLVPDVFLSLDVTVAENWYEKRHRTYFFWEFGKPPDVVIEVVSNRKGNEAGSKMHEYALMGIPYYVIFDPTQQLSDELLRVFELRPRSFQRSADNFLSTVGLGVRLWEGSYEGKYAIWLRWCDRNGVILPTGKERGEQETARANQEMARAEQEAERAQQEAERAQQEAERAQQEAARAARLAARLRELGVDPDQI
jgi:Uma2 family endonuclease